MLLDIFQTTVLGQGCTFQLLQQYVQVSHKKRKYLSTYSKTQKSPKNLDWQPIIFTEKNNWTNSCLKQKANYI